MWGSRTSQVRTLDRRYRRIRTCLPGKVESSSSPIRRQATNVRHPEKVGCRPDRIADVRHPDKVERWPNRIPDVRHPGGMRENFRPGGMSDATCCKGPSACPREREPRDTF